MSIKQGLRAFLIVFALGAPGANAQVDNAREAQRAYDAATQEYNEVTEAVEHYENLATAIVDHELSSDE